jgi:Helix-turn-helix domain
MPKYTKDVSEFIKVDLADIMTKEQAAEYLGVPVRRLEYWRYAKRGPAYGFGAGGPKDGVVYLKADLDAYKSVIRRVVPKLMQNALAEVERVA